MVKLSEPNPKPKSSNVRVHEIWNEKWKTLDVTEEISMTDVIKNGEVKQIINLGYTLIIHV